VSIRVFLLSPANCSGRRAGLLVRAGAESALAARLQTSGVPVGEAFSFVSGLYFRGKLAYASHFGRGTDETPPVRVITPTRGLVGPDTPVTRADLLEFAAVDVAAGGERYRRPIERDAEALAANLPASAKVVLLGSVATTKYTDVLLAALGDRLEFPREFVGRGDMSRGALMLRAVERDEELAYVPVRGAVTSGPRAARVADMRAGAPRGPER
jgi:hypothetical protein